MPPTLKRGARETPLHTCSSRSISAQLGPESLAVLARTGKGTFVRYGNGEGVKASHALWSRARTDASALCAPRDTPNTQQKPPGRKAR